jgi:ribosomal protein S3
VLTPRPFIRTPSLPRARSLSLSSTQTGSIRDLYVVKAIRHVMMRQGVLGIKVAIMLPYDPKNEIGGCKVQLSDIVIIHEPKPDAYAQVADAGGKGKAFEKSY